MGGRGAAVVLGCALVLAASCSDDDGGPEASPSSTATTLSTTTTAPPADLDVAVEGPITGGPRGMPYNPAPEGVVEDAGYVEEEHFVTGTAASYRPTAPFTADGRWSLQPAGEAPYTTRILVRRPEDPADFNGVVVVEWLNVTAGRDSDPDFGFLHELLLDEGYAYVAVSAQATGVEGGGALLEIPGVPRDAVLPLTQWDPERYGGLDHPGDEFSYDIFSQVGDLVAAEHDANPLAGYGVEAVLAVGESQSAFRLVSYIDGVHPLAGAYDGFLVHSRGSSPAAFGEGDDLQPPSGSLVRDDVDVPVLVFQTETDLEFLRSLEARQPDSDHVVTWEVAGTAHADASQLAYGSASGARWTEGAAGFDPTALCGQINDGPQKQVLRAALERLREWVVDGDAPPAAPLLEAADGAIVRDDSGIALGGIRTPAVDAPIEVLTGVGNPSSVICSLFGQAFPLPPDDLAARYGSTDGYVEAVRASADAAVEAGFLLDVDAAAMVEAAGDVTIG